MQAVDINNFERKHTKKRSFGNMKHSHLKRLFIVFIVLYFSIPSGVHADEADDSWMEPNTWTGEHLTLSTWNNDERCCKCSENSLLLDRAEEPANGERPQYTEDGVAFAYYRKLISLLFNRKQLLHCDALQTYERYLSFSISSSQLERLEHSKDPRDLDDVLTEIFAKARNDEPNTYSDGHYRTAHKATGFKDLVVNIFRNLLQVMKTSEIRFLLIAMLVVICGWIVHRKYNISCLTLVAGGLFMYGYVHTYLECNRELEVNEMLKVMQSHEKSPNSGLMGFVRSIFLRTTSKDLEERQTLLKSAKLSLGFCRPDHVVIMYFNDIFLKYLEVLLEKCTQTLSTLQDGLSFPYNIFANVMLICIIGYMLKLTFKYILSPAAWSHHFRQSGAQVKQHSALPHTDSDVHSGDRLSGDNLKILLNALSSTTEGKQPKARAVSGVEDVHEAIESAPANNNSTSSSSSSNTTLPSKNQQNNNKTTKKHPSDAATDVQLEHSSNDS